MPPAFDAPETTGFLDSRSGVLFSADCFGAILPAAFEDARLIPEKDLAEGQMFGATVDSPWLHGIDRAYFANTLDAIRRLAPTLVLSSHLPMASGMMLERFLGALAQVPDHARFQAPDQAAL